MKLRLVPLDAFSRTADLVLVRDREPVLREVANKVEQGHYRTNIVQPFPFEELHEAHRMMRENRASGKLVVVL